jgi:hypothetical protein
VALLLRGLVDNSALSGLDNMTRPISVELIALIRGNVTLQQVAASLQEQADKNGAYIILTDSSGNIVRQLVPLQPQALQPIQVAPGVFPQDVTSALKGKITDADGKTYLYAAYPINRQNSQFISVATLLLVIPRPGILAVLKTIILPFLVAAGLALDMFADGGGLDGAGDLPPSGQSHYSCGTDGQRRLHSKNKTGRPEGNKGARGKF